MAPSQVDLIATAIQEKFARIFMTVASELWLRSQLATAEEVLLLVALLVTRNLTNRLAEKLVHSLCSLMRLAESMATPETECLLMLRMVSAYLIRTNWISQ